MNPLIWSMPFKKPSRIIIVDIDPAEFAKPTMKSDMPIQSFMMDFWQ